MTHTISFKEFVKYKFAKDSSKDKEQERVTSGFENIDWVLDGLSVGLVIMSARPNIGKTALALNMAVNQTVNAGIPVAYYSFDLTGKQLTDRAISILSNQNIDNVRWSNNREISLLKKAVQQLEETPLFCNDYKYIKLKDLIEDIELMVKKENIRVVYIDNLELMAINEGIKVNNACRNIYIALKHLSHKLKITIVVLALANCDIEEREGLAGKHPMLSDINGYYGSLEADEIADVVIIPYRPEYYGLANASSDFSFRDIMIVNIAKNKYGPTGDAYLKFDKRTLKLSICKLRGRSERIGILSESYYDLSKADIKEDEYYPHNYSVFKGVSLDDIVERMEKLKNNNKAFSDLSKGLGLEMD